MKSQFASSQTGYVSVLLQRIHSSPGSSRLACLLKAIAFPDLPPPLPQPTQPTTSASEPEPLSPPQP